MGCGFGTVFAVALGDIAESQAGSASGALNAAQRIADAAGAALISGAYLSIAAATRARTGLALAVLPRLPRRAADVR